MELKDWRETQHMQGLFLNAWLYHWSSMSLHWYYYAIALDWSISLLISSITILNTDNPLMALMNPEVFTIYHKKAITDCTKSKFLYF
jgi:hypothetical protein